MANNSKLGLAKKRKSRKQLMRNFWKKKRKKLTLRILIGTTTKKKIGNFVFYLHIL
jgi:hypothetical protein